MGGEPYCFNCGVRTDLTTDAGDAICRDCLEARTPAAPADERKPRPKRTRKAAGGSRGA